MAYSTNGASTHITALALIKHFGVSAKPISTGAAAVTMTQAMSGQIDVGWASPPFGLAELDEGKIRLIARGSDAPSTHDQTVRVHIVNANALAQRRAVIERFAAAYRETYEWLYTNPEGPKVPTPTTARSQKGWRSASATNSCRRRHYNPIRYQEST